jgi:hypothetical protein
VLPVISDDQIRLMISWRLLHSFVVDATLNQEDDMSRVIQVIFGGMRLKDFSSAVRDGTRVRIRPMREDSGEISFRVEILDDEGGWQGLVRRPAIALGITDEEAQLALVMWLRREDTLLPPDPETSE